MVSLIQDKLRVSSSLVVKQVEAGPCRLPLT